VGDLLSQQRELRELVAAPGDQPTVVAVNADERAEPIVLQLEEPVRVIEAAGSARATSEDGASNEAFTAAERLTTCDS
jgi:hypothetical protein